MCEGGGEKHGPSDDGEVFRFSPTGYTQQLLRSIRSIILKIDQNEQRVGNLRKLRIKIGESCF